MTGPGSSSPRVTIVLCSYNQGEYLRAAVDSALAQTFCDLELIIIDNGSTDDSQKILRSYTDPRVRLVLHDENLAVSKRMNEGVALARGEFLCWLYSDDLYLPDRLEKQVARFDQLDPSYGVVYGRGLGLNQKTGERWEFASRARNGWVLLDILNAHTSGPLDMMSPLTRVEAFRRYPFHEDLFAEGEVIYYRIAMTYKFSFIDLPVVVMRDHGGNRGKAIRRNAEMTFVALDRLEAHPDFPANAHSALRKMRTDYWRNLGWQGVRLSDDVAWARGCYRNALKLSVAQALHPKVIAGLGLSLIPASVRARINALGHKLRAAPGNAVLVDGYGGGSK
jgi:glycosyltransferase involved in cell wall biosynthesis